MEKEQFKVEMVDNQAFVRYNGQLIAVIDAWELPEQPDGETRVAVKLWFDQNVVAKQESVPTDLSD